MIDIEYYREICRCDTGRVSPYRLGLTIGRLTGKKHKNPYKLYGYGYMNFIEGLNIGIIKNIYGRK